MRDSQVIQGDCRTVLAGLPEKSVHCVVTSPPYWGLRDYGVEGQLGLEGTLDQYIANQVEVFRAVRRVLRDDGTLWLNMGDSYASSTSSGAQRQTGQRADRAFTAERLMAKPCLPSKNLIGLPWRLAFALQADEWYLRSAMPWVKRSANPDSASDRPGAALEYVFLLTKSSRYYFFDHEAVRRRPSGISGGACFGGPIKNEKEQARVGASLRTQHRAATKEDRRRYAETGRQWRNADLWFESVNQPHGLVGVGDEFVGLDVTPQAFKAAHFAAFPEKLVEPLIKAGTSEKGCCPECGARWVRMVTRDRQPTRPGYNTKIKIPGGWDTKPGAHGTIHREGRSKAEYRGVAEVGRRDTGRHVTNVQTVGWDPGCDCFDGIDTSMADRAPVPCTVLDPYCGSGTTGVVAKALGRSFTGIEMNPEYCEMARERIRNPRPLPAIPDVAGQLSLIDSEECCA